jgi:hypothetical protein
LNKLLHFRYLCRKMPPVQLLSCVPSVEFGRQQLLLGSPCAASVSLYEMVTCHSSYDETCSPFSRPFPGSLHLLFEYTTVCSPTGGDEGYGICPVSITEVTDVSDRRRRLRPTDLPSWFKAWVSNPLSAATVNDVMFYKNNRLFFVFMWCPQRSSQ